MSTRKNQLARLAEINKERKNLLAHLETLETEQTAIVTELSQDAAPPACTAPTQEDEHDGKPRRRKGVVPLPVGSPIKQQELDALKIQISAMDKSAFGKLGKTFIREWYPKLAKTPAWHEISTALQQHFSAKRQQVAAFAAHRAREVGEAHVNAQDVHA